MLSYGASFGSSATDPATWRTDTWTAFQREGWGLGGNARATELPLG